MNASAGDLDTRITTDLPARIEGPIPTLPHVSAEFFERARIFKGARPNRCRAEGLRRPGDGSPRP